MVIFVMTRSAVEQDRLRAYEKNLAGYLPKRRFGQSFLDTIAKLEHYWRLIELPN
jgi:hypothetical protein